MDSIHLSNAERRAGSNPVTSDSLFFWGRRDAAACLFWMLEGSSTCAQAGDPMCMCCRRGNGGWWVEIIGHEQVIVPRPRFFTTRRWHFVRSSQVCFMREPVACGHGRRPLVACGERESPLRIAQSGLTPPHWVLTLVADILKGASKGCVVGGVVHCPPLCIVTQGLQSLEHAPVRASVGQAEHCACGIRWCFGWRVTGVFGEAYGHARMQAWDSVNKGHTVLHFPSA